MSFQELVFKVVKNCKRSGYVDLQQVRSIDRNLFFSKLKLFILRRWWQLWMKSTAIKQRYRMNLFFVVFCLIVLLPNSMSKLIHNQCKLTCKLLIKTTHTCMQTNNRPFARSGQMVQNHTSWWASCAVELPKQRQVQVPLRNLLTSMCDFVPCDRIVQRAYYARYLNEKLELDHSRELDSVSST